ncbi:uncharacterized protein LOC124810639 [Hydra vulgaris]|uniref:uncharacterized protein LOC124810639 n=1 Tax=Hydra vulgaris TaxID=6087 RepID=UPI001F5EBB4B|nr:uncharacterized protein LOC124810639 [Hydra vulgaris]
MDPVTENEISNLIKTTLRTGKSFDPNSRPTFLLKLIADIISKPLSIIKNNSFQNGIFPDAFKVVKVIPRFKNSSTIYGFCANHSTTQSLIKITKSIRKALDNKNFARGVFVDLQKAFDTVDHSILLKKLENYGIRGISLK